MNTHVLVAYATKHGATAEIANCIANALADAHLNVTVELADRVDDLTRYEAVVLGSAVYAGSWQKDAAHFLSAHEAALGSRQVWLFSSGPTGEEDAATTMHGWRFPEALQPLANRIKPHDIAIPAGGFHPGMHLFHPPRFQPGRELFEAVGRVIKLGMFRCRLVSFDGQLDQRDIEIQLGDVNAKLGGGAEFNWCHL